MDIQLIRNATMRITYADRKLLTDPLLAPKGAYDPFAGNARNPTVDMPFTVEQVLKGIEVSVVSHYHPDHFDEVAGQELPGEIPLFCQPGDEGRFRGKGFQSVIPIHQSSEWEGITLNRVEGRHGTGKLGDRMGQVSGFILLAEGEPTVYWAGDSIWCDPVEKAIEDFNPDIILTHSGGARFKDSAPIIMDAEQTLAVCQAAPDATVIAIHMEALDHCPVTREALRDLADRNGIPPSRLMIPEDGETIRI